MDVAGSRSSESGRNSDEELSPVHLRPLNDHCG